MFSNGCVGAEHSQQLAVRSSGSPTVYVGKLLIRVAMICQEQATAATYGSV